MVIIYNAAAHELSVAAMPRENPTTGIIGTLVGQNGEYL